MRPWLTLSAFTALVLSLLIDPIWATPGAADHQRSGGTNEQRVAQFDPKKVIWCNGKRYYGACPDKPKDEEQERREKEAREKQRREAAAEEAYKKGQAALDKGEWELAIKYLEDALKNRPGDKTIEQKRQLAKERLAHDKMYKAYEAGKAAFERGDWEGAIKYFEEACTHKKPCDKNVEAWLQLALAELRTIAMANTRRKMDDLARSLTDDTGKGGLSLPASPASSEKPLPLVPASPGNVAIVVPEASSGGRALDRPAIVDPSAFVTKDIYESAVRERDRLTRAKARLKAKVEKLSEWRTNQRKYLHQVEKIRAEAIRGAITDVLELIPVGKIVEAMQKEEKYRAIAPHLMAAYRAIQAGTFAANAASGEETAQRQKDILQAHKRTRDALLAIPLTKIPQGDPGRKWLEAMTRLYNASTAVMLFAANHDAGKSRGSVLQTPAPWAELGVDVATALSPPVAVAAAAVSLGGRAYALANISTSELERALQKNFEAQQYLRQKIERIESFITEQERTITMYGSRTDRR